MKRVVIVGVFVALALFGTVAYSVADTVTYGPSAGPESGTVTVNATVNPRLRLTIATPDPGQAVEFGAIDPGTLYTDTVDVTCQSNRDYDLAITPAGDVAALGFTQSQAALDEAPKGTQTYTDTYGVNASWDTTAGAYSVTVQYTLSID